MCENVLYLSVRAVHKGIYQKCHYVCFKESVLSLSPRLLVRGSIGGTNSHKVNFNFLTSILVTFIYPPQPPRVIIGSKDVFERHMSTGTEAFSLFICLDANKFVLLNFFFLIKTIYPKVSTKTLPNDAKIPLPVDVRR